MRRRLTGYRIGESYRFETIARGTYWGAILVYFCRGKSLRKLEYWSASTDNMQCPDTRHFDDPDVSTCTSRSRQDLEDEVYSVSLTEHSMPFGTQSSK